MIVNNINTLRGMARRGFISLHPMTWKVERHWTGMMVRNVFVQEVPGRQWNAPFEYKGKKYRLRYFEGCFHPFVVTLDDDGKTYV